MAEEQPSPAFRASAVERGRHAALLEKGGAYASMWWRQRRAAEREAALAQVAE